MRLFLDFYLQSMETDSKIEEKQDKSVRNWIQSIEFWWRTLSLWKDEFLLISRLTTPDDSIDVTNKKKKVRKSARLCLWYENEEEQWVIFSSQIRSCEKHIWSSMLIIKVFLCCRKNLWTLSYFAFLQQHRLED